MNSAITLLSISSLLGVGSACDSAAQRPTPTPFAIDEAAIAEAAVAFDDGDLIQISAAAVPSRHDSPSVRVWVSEDAEAAYRATDVGAVAGSAGSARFPVGAMIVKEQRDAAGALAAFTVMVKGPSGYAPATNDWHWQRVTPEGMTTHAGQVQFCIDCHTPRAGVDWVFGVPEQNQTP